MTLPTWATEKARELYEFMSGLFAMPVNQAGIEQKFSAALVEAERRGAERMRERAANVCADEANDSRNEDSPNLRLGCHACRVAINALPLEESRS